MAESTLSLAYTELRQEIADYLGFGRTSGNWSSVETDTIDSVLKSGLRTFYAPPPLPGEMVAHEWTFLRPISSVVAWAAVAVNASNTVTGAVASGNTTLTATIATFFPTMIGHAITLTGVTGTWTIVSYTSPTEVVVSGSVPSPSTPRTFSMTPTGDYRLPDDFASLEGPITVATPDTGGEIPVAGEAMIRMSRQSATATGRPTLAAIKPLSVVASTSIGQRFDLMLYPTPETNYTLPLRYRVTPDALTSGNTLPYGGAQHAETLLAACLSVAERRRNDRAGVQYQNFIEQLRASVAMDRQNAPQYLGYNGDGPTLHGQAPLVVTVNGVQY